MSIFRELADKYDRYAALEPVRKITWCGNCGNYGIQNALKRALVLENLDATNTLLCFDVGCSGNGSDKMENMYTIHGLHGRVIPLAAGCKAGNEALTVIASAGDGATFSEGVNHLVHGIRNNYNIVFIMHNNENYGLTTGQASATTRLGCQRTAAKSGVVTPPLNTLDFVLSLQPTFVARGYSSDVEQLTELIREGINHPGFAYIEVLQACPTYNRQTPDEWYAARVTNVATDDQYDPTDIWLARKAVQDLEETIVTGILYKDDTRPSFMETFSYRNKPGVQNVALSNQVTRYDVSDLM